MVSAATEKKNKKSPFMQHYHGLPAFFTAELVQIVKSLEASSQITDPCAILS